MQMDARNQARTEMVERGVSLSAVARALGVTRQRVAAAVDSPHLNQGRRIKSYIARRLRVPMTELWPDGGELS